MPDNKIEVEYITTVAGALQAIEKLNRRLDQQETKLQKVGDTSKKTADGAINSFAKLEQTLKLNEKALQNLSVGSSEFDKQLQKVNRLREAHKKMKETLQGGGQKQQDFAPKAAKGSLEDVASQLKAVETQLKRTASGTAEYAKLEQVVGRLRVKHGELTASMQQLGVVQKAVIPEAAGSFNAVETQLREAENALRGMTAGTKEFVAQTQTVKKLRDEHAKLKTEMSGVRTITGSFDQLEQSLKDNEAALRKMVIGSKAFTDQKKKVDDLRKSLAGAKKDIGESAEKTGGMLSTAVGKVGAMAAGMVSVQVVANALVNELEKVKQLRLDAASASRGVEASIAAMALNIGAENVGPAVSMIRENAPRLGVTQEGLASLLAAGISGGAKDLNEALQLASKTLAMTAGNAQAASPIMSGTMTLAATTGNRNFESVLGQLSQFQQAARGEDLAVSINNMSTALAAANTPGENVKALGGERTLEIASVMSQILQDPKMAVTGTALRTLVMKLDQFRPATSAKLDDGTTSKVTRDAITAYTSLTSVDERIAAMRQNPEIRKQFVSSLENGESKVAIRELVTGTEKVKELERAAAAIVTPIDQASVAFQNLTTVIDENTKILQAENRTQAALQVADTTSIRAKEGQAVKIVQDTFEKMNLSGIDWETGGKIWAAEIANAMTGDNAAQVGIKALEESKQQRKLFGLIPIGGAVSEEDKRKADVGIEELKKISQGIQELLLKQPINVTQPVQRPKASPLPAATAP